MAIYKLIYFNLRGRGEMLRLMFAAAGIEYEDCRVTFEEFKSLKESGRFPFGQLPVLEVDGKMLSQSVSMLKFVARETGFSPSDSFEIAKADMIVDGMADLMGKATKAFFEQDKELREKLMTAFFQNDFPTGLVPFEKLLEASGGKYFADNKMTYADILFFGSIEACFYDKIKKGEAPPLNDFPLLNDLYDRVSNNPGIKAWLKKRPDTDR